MLFSIFVQACEGATYGIVPYVNSLATGSITGIVGAGGNTGAVCFGFAFRQLSNKNAFDIIAASVVASSFLSAFISIKGQSSLFRRRGATSASSYLDGNKELEKTVDAADDDVSTSEEGMSDDSV